MNYRESSIKPPGAYLQKRFTVGAYSRGGLISKFDILLESWTTIYDSFSTKILISINLNFFTIININSKFCWCRRFDVICIRSKGFSSSSVIYLVLPFKACYICFYGWDFNKPPGAYLRGVYLQKLFIRWGLNRGFTVS